MDRRSLLKTGALLGVSGMLPRLSLASGSEADDWSAAFAEALKDDPRLLGWATPAFDQIESGPLQIEGKWPNKLTGTLWRNGPAIHDRHGLRYRHWFDGDGMIQAFHIADGAVSHRARVIGTPKLTREDQAGRRLVSGFGTHIADGLGVSKPDVLNPANISVLEHHGELLALWEGGSASRIDMDTLAWRGFKEWGKGLEGVPFTAHPKLDPDGTLWAFGYSTGPRPMLVLYHVSRTGALVKASLVPVDPLGMVHDFVITARKLMIVISPFVFEQGAGTDFLSAHVWRPELGSRVLVVDKDDFDNRRWYQLPAGFGFHHGNGWQDGDGTVRFDHCLEKDPALVTDAFRNVMQGQMDMFPAPRYTRLTLRPDGRAETESSEDTAEFPQVSPRKVGHYNRYLYHLGLPDDERGYLRTLVNRDSATGATESFDFGPGKIPEEHLFVPSESGTEEDDGFLIGTVLDYERGVSGVNVFDARGVRDGPVATAWLPYPLPLGFHGCFRGTA